MVSSSARSQSTTSKRSTLPTATYSLAETAGLLGCSYTTLNELVRTGTAPVAPVKVGRQYRFSRAAVHRLLDIDETESVTA